MASIRRKPSGRWEARYRNADGKLHARTFATKTEARRWATDMETDVRRGEWVDPRLARVSFAEWTEEYLNTIVHLREATRYLYERTLNTHVLPVFGNRPVSSIEQVDVRRFVAGKLAAGLSPASVRHMRQALRQVLNCAKGSGAIRTNPCDGVRLPMPPKMDPVFLTAQEVDQLAQATRKPYDLLVRFAVATGLRPSELCGVRVGRLNLLAGTVEVAEALTVVRGKLISGPTKTYARRSVGVPRSLCDELSHYLAERAFTQQGRVGPEEYLFTAPTGAPLRRDLLFRRIIRPAITKAGLPHGLRLHDLRHTCAALLILLGAHPKAIQERLGHSSITVTLDIYGHLFPSVDEALTERLDRVLQAGRNPLAERVAERVVAITASAGGGPRADHKQTTE